MKLSGFISSPTLPQMLGMAGTEEIMANGHSDYDLGKEPQSVVMPIKAGTLEFAEVLFYLAPT